MPAQAQKGGGGIDLPILNPGTRIGVDGQHHVSALLLGKETLCPLHRRLGGHQGQSGLV